MIVSRRSRLVMCALFGAVLLTACGRAGAPLKPSEAAREQAKANDQPLPPRPVPNAKNPDKRFILDGLLE